MAAPVQRSRDLRAAAVRLARGLVALGLWGASTGTPFPAHAKIDPPAAAAAVRELPPAERIDRRMNELRVGIAGAALVVWAAGMRARRRGGADRGAPARRALLGLLAALAFATNYNLFVWRGLHRHELYHYYLGAKYFPELGYFRLYECSVNALRERGEPAAWQVVEVTDLRIKQRRPASEVLADADSCRSAFGAERWSEFQDDVMRFLTLMGEERWLGALRDHGYNPSPIWTLLGRPIAELVTPEREGLWQIARLDLFVLAAGFGALGWGFGFEAACLAVITWGATGLNRYGWTGDAFLRQLWFASLLAGLACVRRGRPAWGGALLALSSLLRLFPGLVFAGYGLRELRQLTRERRPRPEAIRVAAGALLAAAVLVAGSLVASGRGFGAWREFAENLAVQTSFTPQNALGLRYVLGFTPAPPPLEVQASARTREEAIETNKRLALARRRPLQAAALALFAVLFWRATRPGDPGREERLEGWEALALGALAIPFLTLPGAYYVGFVAVGAPLATRRPRIGAALLAATLACALSLVLRPSGPWPYVASSVAILAFCAWALVELARPASPPSMRSARTTPVLRNARP